MYDSAVGNVGCLSPVLEPKGIKQTARANASFQAKGILPTVNEGPATFASSKIAYKKIDANLAACRSFSAAFVMGIDEGAQSTVNVRQFQGFIKKALQKL